MSIVRCILSAYRNIQYFVCGRHKYGIMSPGTLCTHEPFEEDINRGDVVHPCVRYIPEGYEGHCWWMVYTPYYAANDKTENPILCYAESNDLVPPTHWKIYCQVQRQPAKGYNSDPNLLYANGQLYVFWRESETHRCEDHGFVRATFGGVVRNGKINNIFGPIVGTSDSEHDTETSPTILQEPDGSFSCLAMDLTFHSKIIKSLPSPLKSIASKAALVLDLLGCWSQQKSHGMAQWSCPTVDGKYIHDRTIKFVNKNPLYRPWHMDFFELEGKLYAIIQTNQCNADICLAASEDRVNFRFLGKPLMTNDTCKRLGIYKPTAGVVDGVLYLYYTAQDANNRTLNKLYVTTIDWQSLTNILMRKI